MIVESILLIIIAYLVGSLSTGMILSKIVGTGDLQKEGSKNIGATNVSRLMGLKWGIITLLGDALKGMIVIWTGRWFFVEESPSGLLIICIMGLAVFLGHLFPLFLRFKGGKGVATALGIFILLAPKVILIAIPVFILAVYFGKFISLGSMLAAGSFPILLILFNYHYYIVLLACGIAAGVIAKHKENILRLIRGEEKPWRLKDKTK